MGSVNRKDGKAKRHTLGQYFTPESTANFCLERTKINTPLVIEPSCGPGVFITKIKKLYDIDVIGLEADEDVIVMDDVIHKNFYDFNDISSAVTFIGNPPFRTPACSITDDPVYGRHDYIECLKKKYGIKGVREEAAFFIIKSVDLIISNNQSGDIYYILPKAIFHNNSRSYKTFLQFLKRHTRLAEVWDLGQDFDKVSADLCYVHFVIDGSRSDQFILNDKLEMVDNFYGINEDLIPFQQIFKKTYLGSVPCESVLLSVRNEPIEHFKQRLYNLITTENLMENLSYNGDIHLVALRKGDLKKIETVKGYVDEIKRLIPSSDFLKDDYYKPIQHRHETRFYFRHHVLKKASFMYQLNPNPTYSFYFPGNPVKGCLDYHGFASFDVNRNCSPSANRTVPVQGIESNLTDEFKLYWTENTNLSYSRVFDYISYILKSDWYKMMKKKYQRWYFGVPKEFDRRFLDNQI